MMYVYNYFNKRVTVLHTHYPELECLGMFAVYTTHEAYERFFPVQHRYNEWVGWRAEFVASAIRGHWGNYNGFLWFQTEEDAVLALLMLSAHP